MDTYSDEQIIKAIKQYETRLKCCSKASNKYHEKMKDNNDYKQKKNEKSKEYYLKNKEKILQKLKEKRTS